MSECVFAPQKIPRTKKFRAASPLALNREYLWSWWRDFQM
jgi:hypothetical protein